MLNSVELKSIIDSINLAAGTVVGEKSALESLFPEDESKQQEYFAAFQSFSSVVVQWLETVEGSMAQLDKTYKRTSLYSEKGVSTEWH